MAQDTGCLFHTHTVDLPVFVTSQAGSLLGTERMHRSLVAILANKLLDIDVAGVAR